MEVGAMIEIPSAAISRISSPGSPIFFSIGTNDLIQYSIAVDRLNSTSRISTSRRTRRSSG